MEHPMTNGRVAGKSLNPFDDDVDDDLLDLSTGTGDDRRPPSPIQRIEKCCNEIDELLHSTSMDPFAMQELKEHLADIEKLLIKDRPESHGQMGPVLQFLLNANIVENIYMFSTRQRVYSKEIRVSLLRFFTEVFTRSPQPILIHQQILRPINKLLRACEGTEDPELCVSLVPLLHTVCILMQENQSLLDLFFVESHVHMQSRFLVFTQLIPHMHASGDMGNRARDALLLCLSLADQLPGSSLTHFIASDSNFCQVLATGLSGLYSGLPSTRDLVVDEWQSPLPVIEKAVPELRTFIQALDFCNSVLQMAPKIVCNTMLTLVREGFLQQVMGAALLQSSESAVMFSLAYLTIFLTHISNVALMREFLCYLTQGYQDSHCILNTLIQHVSSSNHLLCAVTLEFFYVLLDLNCEDVMLELLLKYLLPGQHIMPNQLAIVGAPDLYAQAARKFLQLLPASCIAAEQMFMESVKKSLTPPPAEPQGAEGSKASSPPRFSASPLRGGLHLERPTPVHPTPLASIPATGPAHPLTNLPVLPPPPSQQPPAPAPSTNPFDDPLPPHTSIPPAAATRSRSGSDASSSSLVSMSSISSTPQAGGAALANGTEPTRNKSSLVPPSPSFRFEYVSPEMAYFRSLVSAREQIRECASRCRCWSSVYDRCKASKETLLQLQENRRVKSLEMEDISSVKISVTDEGRGSAGRGDGGGEEGEEEGAGFRSRATTLASNSRMARTVRLRDHDRLHSRRPRSYVAEESSEEARMVAGMRANSKPQDEAHMFPPSGSLGGLRRSGTISGGSRPLRGSPSPRQSPRLERKFVSSRSSQFEDKAGLFLKVVMDKLMEMMQHPPTVNILLTRLISRLAHYPQPLVRSLLLNHRLVLKPGVPNLLTVLQYLKEAVDRYARTQEGFEKRLGRARKTMAYRAQIRNSQVQESRARQLLLRQMTSRTDLDIPATPSTPDGAKPPLEKTSSKKKLSVSSSTREDSRVRTGGKVVDQGPNRRQSVKKRTKKVSTDTLFAVVIFHEFLQELASISEEQSVMHSLLYLPKSTSSLLLS